MLSCVVVFDERVTRVVYEDTHQWLFGSCVIFSQTAVVVLKNLFRSYEIVAEMGRLIVRAFQFEMELDILLSVDCCLS